MRYDTIEAMPSLYVSSSKLDLMRVLSYGMHKEQG